MKYHTIDVHLHTIRVGDTVEIDGVPRTVCASNLKRSPFLGVTLFGDCYRNGQTPVSLVVIETPGHQRRAA